MKLALVADAFDPTNGWGRYAGELARGLIAAGLDVRLVSPRRWARMEDLRAYPDHFEIPSYQHQTRHYAKLLARSLRPLRRAFRGVDAIHCLVEPYAPAVSLSAGRRPYLMSLVGTYARPSRRGGLEGRLLRRALARARYLPAISAFTERRLREETGFTHTGVVPLGVRPGEFAARGDPPQREPGLILAVGECKARKGFDLTVRALARVRADLPSARLAIVGPCPADSPYVRRLRELVRHLDLAAAVTFTGRVDHPTLVNWYRRASAVVMPFREAAGDFEGFGLVLLEAGACGVPVVSTRGTAAEEPVRHGLNGLLVAPDDPDALVGAVRRVLVDADLWRRLAEGGRARAAQMTWEHSTARLLDVYAETLGLGPERSRLP